MNITTEKLTGQDAQNCIELAQSDMMTPDNGDDGDEENETGIEEISACLAIGNPAFADEAVQKLLHTYLKWTQLKYGCTDCWIVTSLNPPASNGTATICAWPKDRSFALKMELRLTI